MNRALCRVVALGAILSATLYAQDATGNWQGTMGTAPGLRAVLQISKAECNGLSGTLYSLGDDPHPVRLTSVRLLKSILSFSIESRDSGILCCVAINRRI